MANTNENDMNLHIRTTADTSGAEGAKDAVKEVVDATKDAGKAEKDANAATAARAKHYKDLAASMSTKDLQDYAAQLENLTEAEREEWKQNNQVIAVLEELESRRQALLQKHKEEAEAYDKRQAQMKEEARLLEQQAQRLKDVEEAQRRVDARKKEEAAAGANGGSSGLNVDVFSEGSAASATAVAAGVAAIGVSAKVATGALMETLQRYKEIRREIGESGQDYGAWTDATLELLEWVTSPLDKLKEGLKAVAGLDELEAALKRQKEAKEGFEKLKEAREKYARAVADDAVARVHRGELDAINAQNSAFERQLQLIQSIRQLNDTRAQAGDAAALKAGEDPAIIAVRQIVRQQESSIQDINAEVERAKVSLSALEQQRVLAIKKLGEAQENNATDEAIREAFNAVEDLDRQIQEAVKVVDFAKKNAEVQATNVIEQATRAVEGVVEQVRNRSTEAVKSQEQKLGDLARKVVEAAEQNNAEIEKAGGVIQGEQKRLIKAVTDLIGDTKLDSEQIAPIRDAVIALARSIQTKDDEVISGLTKIVADITAAGNQFQVINNRFGLLEQRINAIPINR